MVKVFFLVLDANGPKLDYVTQKEGEKGVFRDHACMSKLCSFFSVRRACEQIKADVGQNGITKNAFKVNNPENQPLIFIL